jgi:chloride channel protein, CIC family
MLRVRDIMSRDVIALDIGVTRDQAASHLTEQHIGGVAVVDRGRVVGVLSKTDLCNPQRKGTTAGELMTPLIFHVKADDPVTVAARLMLDERVHRALVIGPEGRLDGIITTTDLVRAEQERAPYGSDVHQPTRHADPCSAVAGEEPER